MQMLKLADKDFKLAILTMLHKVKMVIINENIFLIRKIENIKKESSENSRTKKHSICIKEFPGWVNSRMEMAKERVSEFEERSVEIIQSEKAKNKNSEI